MTTAKTPKSPADGLQLPEPPKTQDEKMTASRHLSLTGGAHYLAKHLGNPETTVVGSDLYLAPVPPAQLQSMSGVLYPRPLCRLRRRPRRLPGTQRLHHLRAGQAAALRPRDRLTLHRTPGHSRQAHFLRRSGHPGILALRRNRTVPRHSPRRRPPRQRPIRTVAHRGTHRRQPPRLQRHPQPQPTLDRRPTGLV